MKSIMRIMLTFCLGCMAGCATTDFAIYPEPATVKEQWHREGLLTWGGTRIYSIGNIEPGYHTEGNELTYTVDNGEKDIKVWYYANRNKFSDMLFWLSEPVTIRAPLKPNGRYELTSTLENFNQENETVTFKLVDLNTQEILVESQKAPIKRAASPFPQGPVYVPIYIPAQ